MKRYLPPLNSLRAFEAAARHCNFRKAANELSVSQSAISHQLKLLESKLGVELFHRSVHSVELSEAGHLYYPVLRDAFDRMSDVTERISLNTKSTLLTVQVYVTFATAWLIPRLSDFQNKHPDIQVNINTTHIDVDFEHSDVDVCVFMGYKDQANVQYDYLFTSEIYPVCGPGLLAKAKTLKHPEDLLKQNLLYINHAEQDWSNWFSAAGVNADNQSAAIRFDSYSLALDAAIDGAGVALALSPFGTSDVNAGRLVKPFDIQAKAYGDWYLAYRENRGKSEKVIAFQNWLLDQIQNDKNITLSNPESTRPSALELESELLACAI